MSVQPKSIIKHLRIEKFRKLPPTTIPIGTVLTVIAGRNGTSKSTILGMLAQPFGARKKDLPDTDEYVEKKDIFGQRTSSLFSEIFNMSPKHDIAGNHEYHVGLHFKIGPYENEVPVKSFKRFGNAAASKNDGANDEQQKTTSELEEINRWKQRVNCRLVTGANRTPGFGNIDIPLIYLGLRRLFPLGETRKLASTDFLMSDEEEAWFNSWHSRLISTATPRSFQLLDGQTEKKTLAPVMDDYDQYVISAGEDNLGKILGAIISFKRLKTSLGTNYKGGLLLIDEVEASFHPAAQIKLIELFFEAYHKYNIQTVVTSHSADFVKMCLKKKGPHVKVAYLRFSQGTLEVLTDADERKIKHDLYLEINTPVVPLKVRVYSEDPEARLISKHLLSADLQSHLLFVDQNFGHKDLSNLAKYAERVIELQSLKQCIFLVDGDVNYPALKNNIISLPGEQRPENIIYSFLDTLDEADPLWNKLGYGDKAAFRLRMVSPDNLSDRSKMKHWFCKSLEEGCWGPNDGQILFAEWKKRNNLLVRKFANEVRRAIKRLQSD